MKGKFITFEGGDGAGKTSLIASLHQALTKKGAQVVETRAPGGTYLGKILRDLLLHPEEPAVPTAELFLYLADRAQHVEKVIKPALEEGNVVLCDRYNDSTVAYQGVARGFGAEKVGSLCHFATAGLEPNLTLYLDIDPELGLERIAGKRDQIEGESLVFHQKIREAFLAINRREPKRFRLLDGSLPKEEVLREALKIIDL